MIKLFSSATLSAHPLGPCSLLSSQIASEAELLLLPPPILPNPRPPPNLAAGAAPPVPAVKMLSRISRLGAQAVNRARLGDPLLHSPPSLRGDFIYFCCVAVLFVIVLRCCLLSMRWLESRVCDPELLTKCSVWGAPIKFVLS
jgi:hypothetical protein